MKFEKTEVFNFEGAIRGARNPLESWDKSDSGSLYVEGYFIIGDSDMNLLQRLLKASIKEGNSHSKFLRQIMVSVDVTAPLYWWKEFDTYKVGTVANSTSTMHKLSTTPITLDRFEHSNIVFTDRDGNTPQYAFLQFLEYLRQRYLETRDKEYWEELIKWLPESWLQTRTVTMNYQVIRQMYFDRRNHKLTEWSVDFIDWVKTLPYSEELIMYEGGDVD